MAITCRLCGFTNFRISRFRLQKSDLVQMLLLRLLVRCLNCDERTFTSLKTFFAVRRERRERHREHPSA
jgi:hypothetical protein